MLACHQTLRHHTTNLFSGQGIVKSSRVGRPRAALKPATSKITVRMRRLLDTAHDGNVHEASKASGIPYATLRDLYTGRSTNPSLKTLEAISAAYGFGPAWFTHENQPEEVPAGGWISFVSPFVGAKSRFPTREIVIPFASWPLPAIYQRLCSKLEAMPVDKSRPIIGDEIRDAEISRLVTEFLLAPLLASEALTQREIILHSGSELGPDHSREERWIRQLRRLGIVWEEALTVGFLAPDSGTSPG
jgi:hypothetical protein